MIFDRQSGRLWWQIHEGKTISWRGQRINDARTKVRDLMLYSRFWWGKGRGCCRSEHTCSKKYSHCMLCKTLCLRRKPKNRECKFVDTWVEGVLSSGADGKGSCCSCHGWAMRLWWRQNERVKKPRCLFCKSVMPVFCRKKCCVGWSQCKIQLMYSSSRNELHFAWSSLILCIKRCGMNMNEPDENHEDAHMKSEGPTDSTLCQDQLVLQMLHLMELVWQDLFK